MKTGQSMPVEQMCARIICVFSTGAPPALPDFVPCFLQHRFVGRAFPLHQVLNDAEQARALLLLRLLGREKVWKRRRVVHHLREDHRARRRERASGPPQMQSARMSVSNGLFPPGCVIDRLKWQSDFDEFFPVWHAAILTSTSRAAENCRVGPPRPFLRGKGKGSSEAASKSSAPAVLLS